MTTLLTFMQVAGEAAEGGIMQKYGSIIMLVAMFAIMYFFIFRPQNKKQKEINNFRKSLDVGSPVMTAGGIHGVVKEIHDDHLVVTIADKVNVKIDKNSVFASAEALQSK